ncbi:MAG: winged helix-turn-helix domain-containing protein [Betaproteobacteria bacterium]|nr:winged helix-turn-helix domain-containing protein [Betaproteobacteria bacterium]
MATIYKIGPFRLDGEAEILFRDAEPVALGERAVVLLRALVERAGAPVSKDILIEAAWHGVTVEENNLTVQIAALRRIFEEEAGGVDWIETLPRRGYRYVGPVVAIDDRSPVGLVTAASSSVLPLPHIPSIAVLSFKNMSGDPEQEYFADGIVDDIITALSRMRSLFVIARSSSFTYKGKAVDVKQVGRELGVRYVLEGGVRKSGDRVRITAQLIDATAGAHLWADRFDSALEDIFDLQDRVAASVVAAIAPKLEQAEIERARRKPTESLDAYDHYLRGLATIYQSPSDRKANNDALQLFVKAIELDQDFAIAYGVAAWCYVWRKANGWMVDRKREIAEAERLARQAVALGKDDAAALARGGHALAFVVGELDAGVTFIDRALALNPNVAVAWYLSGFVRLFVGEPELAIEHLAKAMRLSPLDPLTFAMQTGCAHACLFVGRYEEASSWSQRALREQPDFMTTHRIAAASYALAGRPEEARQAITRLRQLDPSLRVSNLGDQIPLRRPEDLAIYQEGLRRAGLPE